MPTDPEQFSQVRKWLKEANGRVLNVTGIPLMGDREVLTVFPTPSAGEANQACSYLGRYTSVDNEAGGPSYTVLNPVIGGEPFDGLWRLATVRVAVKSELQGKERAGVVRVLRLGYLTEILDDEWRSSGAQGNPLTAGYTIRRVLVAVAPSALDSILTVLSGQKTVTSPKIDGFARTGQKFSATYGNERAADGTEQVWQQLRLLKEFTVPFGAIHVADLKNYWVLRERSFDQDSGRSRMTRLIPDVEKESAQSIADHYNTLTEIAKPYANQLEYSGTYSLKTTVEAGGDDSCATIVQSLSSLILHDKTSTNGTDLNAYWKLFMHQWDKTQGAGLLKRYISGLSATTAKVIVAFYSTADDVLVAGGYADGITHPVPISGDWTQMTTTEHRDADGSFTVMQVLGNNTDIFIGFW